MNGQESKNKASDFLENHAVNYPDKPAVIGLERTITFGELRKKVRAIAKSI